MESIKNSAIESSNPAIKFIGDAKGLKFQIAFWKTVSDYFEEWSKKKKTEILKTAKAAGK